MGEPSPNTSAPHEEAVHERRNWVRLTFACNNRCAFCLDAATHDGGLRPHEELVEQVVRGREAGATRLVLSGGEATLHPSFLELVRLGAELGYRRVQTVTNGRRFAYPAFLDRALAAGLGEITFSVHGPDARTHDALVGVRGAYAQTLAGLRRALADGRPIVNVDVVLNRHNVDLLRATLEGLVQLGVREFELLWPVPFGRAFGEGRPLLLDAASHPAITEALDYARAQGVTVWLSRVPAEVLDGHDDLIPDPHKLFDEVRGRRPELLRLVEDGVELDCRDEERCPRCALYRWCRALDELWRMLATGKFDVLRVEAEPSARPAIPFGTDPASERRAVHTPEGRARRTPLPKLRLEEVVARSPAKTLWLVAPDLRAARVALRQLPTLPQLELEVSNSLGLGEALTRGELEGRRVVRVVVKHPPEAESLLAVPADFDVVLPLSGESCAWLLEQQPLSPRLRLQLRMHERASEAAVQDVDLAQFFGRFSHPVPVEWGPQCLTGRPPATRPRILDWSTVGDDGHLDPFRFTERFLATQAWSKAGACRDCPHDEGCLGLPVQHRRACVTRPFPPTSRGQR